MLTNNDAETRVLVVDDKLLNVTVLTRLLLRAGIGHVEGITDSGEVLDRVRNFEPDVVLLDLHMPKPDGFQLLEWIGQLSGDSYLPVVIITADIDQQSKERALVGGAADFLTKPFPATETLLRIRNLVRTRRLHQRVQRDAARLTIELEEHVISEHELQKRVDRINAVVDDADNVLTMVFQPIVSLDTGAVAGVEALARFSAIPIRPPNEWFAEAAEAGIATKLELTAIRGALRHAHLMPPRAFLSVNTSRTTLMSPAFADLLEAGTDRPVVVELTEHEPIVDYAPVNDAMIRLRRSGARLAVDDAGTGFAGLHHILRLQPDFIKLDRVLVTDIDHDPARRSLASALVTFSRETHAEIIAEGIETAAELDTLRSLGVHYGQGYHLARPGFLPLDDLATSPEAPLTLPAWAEATGT